MALFCYSHPMAWDKLKKKTGKSWARSKIKCPNGQTRPGQVKSGPAKLFGYSACYIEKLPTKFHINWAIEPKAITVHTQIASGHLSIFAICTSKPVSWKVLKCPPFFLAYVMVMFTICAKYCWFSSKQKYLKNVFSTLNLKGQRSFRVHDTFIT